jgi:hypothetical protein
MLLVTPVTSKFSFCCHSMQNRLPSFEHPSAHFHQCGPFKVTCWCCFIRVFCTHSLYEHWIYLFLFNLFNIHNCYTGIIGQVSWKQPNTTCQQLLRNVQNNIQDNVQYNPFWSIYSCCSLPTMDDSSQQFINQLCKSKHHTFSEDNSPILLYNIETNLNCQTTVYRCYWKILVENKSRSVINTFKFIFRNLNIFCSF